MSNKKMIDKVVNDIRHYFILLIGSAVVECLTQDREVVASSLIGVTVFCP